MTQTPLSGNILDLSPGDYVLPRPRPVTPAHIIRDDAEAVAVSRRLAENFAVEAAARDRDRRLPVAELDQFSQSGLWGITVPKEYGGADVSHVTLAEVFANLSGADPALAQIAQNHFTDVDTIRWAGDDPQKRFFFGEALHGIRFGNAIGEPGKWKSDGFATRLETRHDQLILTGHKIYATGALLAHWVQVSATTDEGQDVLVFVPRDAPGLEVIDDWSGFGQRTTASGTVRAENVRVTPDQLLHTYRTSDRPTSGGTFAQIIHVAVDAGIAQAAVGETITLVKTMARPWVDAQVENAADDPLTLAQIGDLEYRLHAAEALTARAARLLDASAVHPTEAGLAAASIAVAEAKIATTEIALLATSKLFELAGTRSVLEKYDLDRHWRNARTHTLHDPVRWKYHAVGNYYLNGKNPPRHAWS